MNASTRIEDLPDTNIENEEEYDEQGLSSNKIFNEITNLDTENGEDNLIINDFEEDDTNNMSKYFKDFAVVFVLIFTSLFFYKDIVKILTRLPLFNIVNPSNQIPFMIFISTVFSLVFFGNKYFLD